MELEFLTDPAARNAAAKPFLAADPVVSTVVSSVALRAAAGVPVAGPAGGPRPWWLVVRDGGGVVGAGMRTMGFAPYLLPMPLGAGAAVGAAMLGRGEHAEGANGAIGPASELCEVLAAAVGGSVETAMATRLHVLGTLTAPVGVPGRGRPARHGDVDLLTRWRFEFAAEAHADLGEHPEPDVSPESARDSVLESVAARTSWVWEDGDGAVVCAVSARQPAYGVARVGPVYTPPRHRRHGYAAACTALASRALLDAGAHRVCLYTDLANPTSNGVYRRIGYRPVLDMANLVVTQAVR